MLNYEKIQKIIQDNHPNKELKVVIYIEYDDEEEVNNSETSNNYN